MATYTSNYAWTKPEGGDPVDITVLNNNLDSQDNIVHNAYMQFAPVFSTASTYAVDDVVLYANNLYKCITAVTVAGAWDSTKWTQVKVSDICGGGGGGGGTTNYNQLTNKPQINSVELSGNKTSAQLGLMASDGVVANPTGQTTSTLTALEVGGTKYAVGGGSGTSDYTNLTNKPSINSVTLSGNKTTADLGLQDAIQLATMPTAGATYVGKVVQFVGTTDANYTHGYFYECTTDGSTYVWTQLNVQPSSGSGGGHTIVNGAGTSMTQRDALQFTGGLSVSDDSTNERTVVSDDYELITWTDWQTIVANHEEELHPNAIITGVPDADGNISVDLMTKLWENPNPTASFAAQDVNVSVTNGDFVMILAKWTANDNSVQAFWGKVGDGSIIINFGLASASGSRTMQRYATISNTAKIAFSDAIDAVGTTASATNNNRCIPIVIYRIKTTASVKVSAIAENVSTSADKCMLSDGVTSVEDVVECTQTTAGNYRLRATVGAGGAVTYSWVAE